jgi:hypothetical protein
MLFDQTGSDVGEEGCMVAAGVKTKKILALLPSLRCKIECSKSGS